MVWSRKWSHESRSNGNYKTSSVYLYFLSIFFRMAMLTHCSTDLNRLSVVRKQLLVWFECRTDGYNIIYMHNYMPNRAPSRVSIYQYTGIYSFVTERCWWMSMLHFSTSHFLKQVIVHPWVSTQDGYLYSLESHHRFTNRVIAFFVFFPNHNIERTLVKILIFAE